MASDFGEKDGVLQPGLQIRPVLTHEDVTEMLGRLYGLRDIEIVDLNAYDDRNYHIRVKDKDPFLWPHGYVLKVVNTLDSQKPSHIEAQTELLIYLDSHGFTCPQPVKNIDGKYFSMEDLPKIQAPEEAAAASSRNLVRMLTFQPGQILAKVQVTSQLMFQLGGFVARLDRCLQEFHHPVFENHESLWCLRSASRIKQFMFAVEDEQHRLLVDQVIEEFERNVMPHYASMTKGTVHGDLNEQNLVCSEGAEGWRINVVLDLGDCHVSSYLFELAVCLCYAMLLQCPPPLDAVDVAGHVLAGYCAVAPLADAELRMLKICVCSRLCQSLVLGAYSFLQSPDNTYVLITAKKGWGLLHDLWNTPQSELERRWKDTIASYQQHGDTA